MQFYLVFDFETTGLENSSAQPINFPVQFACQLTTAGGVVVDQFDTLIKGAINLSDWTQQNCPHLTLEKCNSEGIELVELLQKIISVIEDSDCILVAHNLQYDWDKVLCQSLKEKGLEENMNFKKLKSLKRMCTMVNDKHKYFNAKWNKWCGPKLMDLAYKLNVDFDSTKAHDAMYDVTVTRKCLCEILRSQ
tara:strand:+ start:48 stop:623 length:576 start_codon:yes stop_codon:yes gene_type:complete